MSDKKRPIERDSAIAISLSQISKEKALSYYSELYKQNKSKISSSECIIPDDVFLKILNDCLILSHQKIEERLISTKLIFPNEKNAPPDWPQGVNFIPIEEVSFSSIDLQSLKKYFEMASDPNSFLVINFLEAFKKKFNFGFRGFMFVEQSLNSLIFKYEQKRLSMKQKNLKDLLGYLYNSVIFSVDNGRVSVSYLNEPFLMIEKGVISQIPYFELETMLISHHSKGFQEKLKAFIDVDVSQEEIIKMINSEKVDVDLQKKMIIRTLIDYKVFDSIRNIILKISEERHGSTLIFNFEGGIDDHKLFQPGAIKLEIPYGSALLKLAELKEPSFFHTEESREINNIIKTYENAIVSLSKTDGAMVFNHNLDLILVGAFLKTRSSASLSGGARKKSAEGFINDNEGTMAVVISQDGSKSFLLGRRV